MKSDIKVESSGEMKR